MAKHTFLTHIPSATARSIGLGGYDANQHHKAVMSIFADNLSTDGSPRAAGNILFRRARNGDTLVRSEVGPTAAPQGAMTLAAGQMELVAGAMVRFELAFNNVTRTGGKAVPTDAAAMLERKLTGAFDELTIDESHTSVLQLNGAALSVAHITGTGKVADAAKLTELLRVGVGRARAYGCGLLTVVPA